jgi:hypothetical protein
LVTNWQYTPVHRLKNGIRWDKKGMDRIGWIAMGLNQQQTVPVMTWPTFLINKVDKYI